VNSLIRDFRYAARVLRKSPVTTTVAVLALALGIGVNASSFISINSIVLHPLPYPQLDRIVTIWGTLPKIRSQQTPLSPADLTDVERQSHSFTALAGYRDWDANLTGHGTPERVRSSLVSPNFFTVLGTRAKLGRTFADEQDEPGLARMAVVSEGFWKSHLASSAAAIGKSIFVNGSSYTVIGVMPDRFDFPLGNQIWAPLTLTAPEQHDREHHDVKAVGLLRSDVSAEEASAELADIALRLQQQYPNKDRGRSIRAMPLRSLADNVTNHFVITLLGAAGFVLLLACANVGNLQLARATNREKEIAVRAALGAGRMQIARELLAEMLLISGVASVIGLLLASWNLSFMKSTIPAFALRAVPGLRTMGVDGTVILFTIALCFAAGVLCSVPAVVQVVHGRMRADMNDVLRGRGGAAGSTPARNWLRSSLITFELALALVLLVGAGLMVKTFERLLYVNQGFDPKNVLTLQVSLPKAEFRDPAQMTSFYDRVLERLARLRGASAAGLMSYLGPSDSFAIEGQPEPRPGEPRPGARAINAGYFEAMRIPVIEGREISGVDRRESPRTAVVTKNFARHYWPNSSAMGRRIKLNATSGWLTIVGVSGNVIEDWFTNQPSALVYVSYAQFPSSQATLLVRTAGDPMQAATPALRDIRQVDKSVPVYDVTSMEQAMYEERSGVHAAAKMMTTYAVIALLLAVTGIYAVISYFVAARTHDIGVRMALGANRADVFKMSMSQCLRFMLAGLAFGIPLAALLSQLMSRALFNVVEIEASTFAIFTAVLVASGLLASYLPSRRATQIDPMTALRNE
jgi:putative ABC transport system permease protein